MYFLWRAFVDKLSETDIRRLVDHRVNPYMGRALLPALTRELTPEGHLPDPFAEV